MKINIVILNIIKILNFVTIDFSWIVQKFDRGDVLQLQFKLRLNISDNCSNNYSENRLISYIIHSYTINPQLSSMKSLKSQFEGKNSKQKSKTKSHSKDKTIQKIYATPQKSKKLLEPRYKDQAKRDTKSRVNNQKSEDKQVNSNSKSKQKNKTVKGFTCKKNVASPYKSPNQQSKKKINMIEQKCMIKDEIQLCKFKIKNQKYEQASIMLKKMIKNNPKNFEVSYLFGYLSQQLNNSQQAKKYYRHCIKLWNYQNELNKKNKSDMEDLERLQKLARCNFYLSLFEVVIDICTKILTKKPDADIYVLKGKSQLARKKFGPAIDSFNNAISLDKTNAALYQYQGDCYKQIQAYELALNCYLRCSQLLEVDRIRILQKKAQCFRSLGNKKKQEEINEKISKLRKQFGDFVVNVKTPLIRKKNETNPEQNYKQYSSTVRSQTYYGSGFLPELRPHTPSLSEAQQYLANGNPQISLGLINKIINQQGQNIRNLHLRAVLLFSLQDYEGCQKDINLAIKILDNPTVPLISFLLPQSQQIQTLNSLKIISNRLKELNAYSLTQQQDRFIIQRRRKCLQQALNVLKTPQSRQQSELMHQQNSLLSSKLTMILQESSIRSSRIYDNQQNCIFLLRNVRKVLQNWVFHKFSLESLQQTTELAFNLVRIRYKQFSILPMHILYYTVKQQNSNKTFYQINQQINSILSKMCKKYPPNQVDLTKSNINLFDIKWQKKQKINLFKFINKTKFVSYKELHKAIQAISERAEQEYYKMNQICRQICVDNFQGFGFKIGLKLDKSNTQIIQQRVLCRIIQKMFENQIKQKNSNFFNDIKVKPNKKLLQYLQDIDKQWEQTIDQIIKQKNDRNQQIQCNVYDFMRAKCMFNSVKEIRQVTLQFIQRHSRGQIYLLQINDRLSYKTRDVVLKFRIYEIVGQLQLALEFQSIQNQFNHGLYQLFRSPFGPFFASIMWFSGFAMKKNQIFFKQKIKWSLKGLQHLRKFIYQQQLNIILINQQEKQTSSQLIFTDFNIAADSITTHICTKTHLYLKFDRNSLKIVESVQRPQDKFVLKVIKDNFLINQSSEYLVNMRIEGQSKFICLRPDGQLYVICLQDSTAAQTMKLRIKPRPSKESPIILNKKGSVSQFNRDAQQYFSAQIQRQDNKSMANIKTRENKNPLRPLLAQIPENNKDKMSLQYDYCQQIQQCKRLQMKLNQLISDK